jgi:hypothetical protein
MVRLGLTPQASYSTGLAMRFPHRSWKATASSFESWRRSFSFFVFFLFPNRGIRAATAHWSCRLRNALANHQHLGPNYCLHLPTVDAIDASFSASTRLSDLYLAEVESASQTLWSAKNMEHMQGETCTYGWRSTWPRVLPFCDLTFTLATGRNGVVTVCFSFYMPSFTNTPSCS